MTLLEKKSHTWKKKKGRGERGQEEKEGTNSHALCWEKKSRLGGGGTHKGDGVERKASRDGKKKSLVLIKAAKEIIPLLRKRGSKRDFPNVS